MKTTKLFIVALLALPLGAQAQSRLEAVFQKIANAKGIELSTSHNIMKDEKNPNVNAESTVIYDVRIGRPNFNLLHDLQEAFRQETDAATLYTCFNPFEGSTRQQWSIQTKQGSDIRVGQHPNSSYAVAVYFQKLNETTYSNNRIVFAAEWWDTDDKNIKQARLIRSFGEKPQRTMRTTLSYTNGANVMSSMPLPSQDNQTLGHVVYAYNKLAADSVVNIPFDPNNKNAWANIARRNIGRLSNSDWHRLFGLLTEQAIGYAHRNDTKGKEELVVAVGLILDLCKNAPLDEEERNICARRLDKVHFELGVENAYARDMLRLSKQRLSQK